MRKGVIKAGRLFAAALAVCMAFLLCVPALAAEKPEEGRVYKVRVYAGKQGRIDGRSVWEKEYKAGERMEFRAQKSVGLEDEKYYVKGIRESGKDYKEDNPSFVVERDVDYVVSYGIRGSSVAYTVNYLDGDGNSLLPSETYYGNVGDQPVIAYQYIEGWLPQAYNLTKTLSDNAAENVFDFVYTRTTGAAGTGANAAEEAEGAAGAGEAGTGNAENGNGANGANGENGEVVPVEEEGAPQELRNLDEEGTPLANLGENLKNLLDPDGDGLLLKMPKTIILGTALLLALPFIILAARRKKEKEEQR